MSGSTASATVTKRPIANADAVCLLKSSGDGLSFEEQIINFLAHTILGSSFITVMSVRPPVVAVMNTHAMQYAAAIADAPIIAIAYSFAGSKALKHKKIVRQ